MVKILQEAADKITNATVIGKPMTIDAAKDWLNNFGSKPVVEQATNNSLDDIKFLIIYQRKENGKWTNHYSDRFCVYAKNERAAKKQAKMMLIKQFTTYNDGWRIAGIYPQ